MGIITVTLIVFSIVLTITKAKILGWKREFVEQRYIASKIEGQDPGWIHRWWHSIFHCPMCCGFWVAAVICLVWPVYGWVADVLIVYGLNWLLHCIENVIFLFGKNLEKKLDESD